MSGTRHLILILYGFTVRVTGSSYISIFISYAIFLLRLMLLSVAVSAVKQNLLLNAQRNK